MRAIEAGRGAGYSVVFERHAEYMAEWQKSQRPASEIELKDAQSLRALLGPRDAALPFLTQMTERYEDDVELEESPSQRLDPEFTRASSPSLFLTYYLALSLKFDLFEWRFPAIDHYFFIFPYI